MDTQTRTVNGRAIVEQLDTLFKASVKRLREALGVAGSMVETVRGAGYRLTAQPKALLQA